MKTPSIRPLSSELAAKAKSELNESTKKIPDDLDALKQWLAKQTHLTARFGNTNISIVAINVLIKTIKLPIENLPDDQFLIAFLRGCKYSLERAKEKIDSYYTVRSAIPEFFQERDPEDPKLQEVFALGFVFCTTMFAYII